MNATKEPSHESESADMARLLPAPAHSDLSADRQLLLKELFMSNLLEEEAAAPRIRRRKRLTIGLAAPLALAAAAAVAVGISGNQAESAKARPTTSKPTGAQAGTVRIANVGYTVDIKNGDEFKVTVLRKGAHKVNATQLKKDLARLGLKASVTRTEPNCKGGVQALAHPDGRGNYVATFDRQLLNKGPVLYFFPMGPPPKIKIEGNTATAVGPEPKNPGDFLVVGLAGKPSCFGFTAK